MNALFDLLEAAERYAATAYVIQQLDEAVQFVANVQRLTGAKSISDPHDQTARADRIMRAMALVMYQGDDNKARSFINGFAWSRTADGIDVEPDSSDDIAAWEAGIAADPGREAHKAAQAAATAAFRAKFNEDKPSTQKGHAYWVKQYRAGLQAQHSK